MKAFWRSPKSENCWYNVMNKSNSYQTGSPSFHCVIHPSGSVGCLSLKSLNVLNVFLLASPTKLQFWKYWMSRKCVPRRHHKPPLNRSLFFWVSVQRIWNLLTLCLSHYEPPVLSEKEPKVSTVVLLLIDNIISKKESLGFYVKIFCKRLCRMPQTSLDNNSICFPLQRYCKGKNMSLHDLNFYEYRHGQDFGEFSTRWLFWKRCIMTYHNYL